MEKIEHVRRERAESLYAELLARRAAGEPFELERLIAEHVDLAEELRAAHRAWSRVDGIWRALEASGSPPSPDPSGPPSAAVLAALQGASLDSVSGRILRQLQERTPSGSRYEQVEEVARGGMGVILKVWDPDLRRHLAMKVAFLPENAKPTEDRAEERPLARFLEEAQITGQLDHPGIVPVHELGLDPTGRVYFTMQLVRGEELGAIFHKVATGADGWTLARATRVLLKVCEALAYAHSKGVIHRDLKPANVMVGRFGEVYVMDWGLARVVGSAEERRHAAGSASTSFHVVRTDRREARDSGHDGAAAATMDGDVLGTPAYMSPEQARGETHLLDERSDVYSLGAILYHLLAGHMPYVPAGGPDDAYHVWMRVRSGPPESLDDIAPRAPAELVAICEKAMARERQERYPDMAALAEDLSAFLDGKVVRAYETGALAELRKWVRRNRGTALATAAAVLATLVGLAATITVQRSANSKEKRANEELRVANAKERASAAEALAQSRRADENATLAERKSQEALAGEREATRQRRAADRVVAFLGDLFRAPDPDLKQVEGADGSPAGAELGEVVSVKQILDRGAHMVDAAMADDPLLGARLMDAMGSAYLGLGLYADATPLLEEAYAKRRDGLAPESRERLRSHQMLGVLYSALGRYDDARTALEQTLSAAERFLPSNDPDTLETTSDLAQLAYRQGRPEEAERLYGEALTGMEDVQGPAAPGTLRTLRELAILYRHLERFEEAEDLFQQVLSAERDSVGPDHPDTLRAERDLAGNEYLWNRLDQARPKFEKALDDLRRVLGDDHPDTLICANDLANLVWDQGQLAEARDRFRSLLPRYVTTFGATHPYTLTVRSNLGGVLVGLGDLDGAQASLEESLAVARGARGAGDLVITHVIENSLAAVYYQKGRDADAERLFLAALAPLREKLGASHSNVLQLLQSLVTLYADEGRWADAEERCREWLAAAPEDSPGRPAMALQLARLGERGK